VPPPHSPPRPPSSFRGKYARILQSWYIYHNTFSIRSISDISLLKEFVDQQLFAPGRKQTGKKLEIFYKKMLKYLEKSTNLQNHKTGKNKNTAPKP
jgi:hypothetical protein